MRATGLSPLPLRASCRGLGAEASAAAPRVSLDPPEVVGESGPSVGPLLPWQCYCLLCSSHQPPPGLQWTFLGFCFLPAWWGTVTLGIVHQEDVHSVSQVK